MGSQISNVDQGGSLSSSSFTQSENAKTDVSGDATPAQLQVETTQVDSPTGKVTTVTPKEDPKTENSKENVDLPKNENASKSETEKPTKGKPEVKLTEEDVASIDVGELTAQILEMINQDDDSANHTTTDLLKKNVELQEFMVKLIELLKEKTNLSANLERQNAALTNQAKSLRDVINITKDLLNIRNMEVEHLHVDMTAMEKCIKEERERHNLAVQRLTEAMGLNDKLKAEYLNQMELFGKLKEKYNEKVVLLTRENQKLKEELRGAGSSEQTAQPQVVESIPKETAAESNQNGDHAAKESPIIEPYSIGPTTRDTVKEKNLINAAHSPLIIDTNIIPTEPQNKTE